MTQQAKLQNRGNEAGNAVTLTLLGLAVAILAGVVVLYYIGKSAPEPITPIVNTEELVEQDEEGMDPRAGWNTYEDPTHEFSIQYPPGWIVMSDVLFGQPAISVYPAEGATGTPPYSHLDVGVPHVSIYPQGLGTEGLFAEARPSDVIVLVSEASAKDYVVSSGRAWGTLAEFAQYPESWAEYGFVFAGASIEELELGCLQDGEEVAFDSCNHFEGDQTLIHGFVDPTTRSLVTRVLLSFEFAPKVSGSSTSTVSATEPATDLITVEKPQPGDTIGSPLVVRGEARGTWYFEGDFPVRLETAAGELLAEIPATALDDWMTEDYVPFEVTLAFEETTATSGRLLLVRDNPSGLTEYDMEVEIPVLFEHTDAEGASVE